MLDAPAWRCVLEVFLVSEACPSQGRQGTLIATLVLCALFIKFYFATALFCTVGVFMFLS